MSGYEACPITQIESTNLLLIVYLLLTCKHLWGTLVCSHGFFSLPGSLLCSNGFFPLPHRGEFSDGAEKSPW